MGTFAHGYSVLFGDSSITKKRLSNNQKLGSLFFCGQDLRGKQLSIQKLVMFPDRSISCSNNADSDFFAAKISSKKRIWPMQEPVSSDYGQGL